MSLVRRIRSFTLIAVASRVGQKVARRVAASSEKNNGGKPTSLSQVLYLLGGRR